MIFIKEILHMYFFDPKWPQIKWTRGQHIKTTGETQVLVLPLATYFKWFSQDLLFK